jgi:hypothetical protein
MSLSFVVCEPQWNYLLSAFTVFLSSTIAAVKVTPGYAAGKAKVKSVLLSDITDLMGEVG